MPLQNQNDSIVEQSSNKKSSRPSSAHRRSRSDSRRSLGLPNTSINSIGSLDQSCNSKTSIGGSLLKSSIVGSKFMPAHNTPPTTHAFKVRRPGTPSAISPVKAIKAPKPSSEFLSAKKINKLQERAKIKFNTAIASFDHLGTYEDGSLRYLDTSAYQNETRECIISKAFMPHFNISLRNFRPDIHKALHSHLPKHVCRDKLICLGQQVTAFDELILTIVGPAMTRLHMEASDYDYVAQTNYPSSREACYDCKNKLTRKEKSTLSEIGVRATMMVQLIQEVKPMFGLSHMSRVARFYNIIEPLLTGYIDDALQAHKCGIQPLRMIMSMSRDDVAAEYLEEASFAHTTTQFTRKVPVSVNLLTTKEKESAYEELSTQPLLEASLHITTLTERGVPALVESISLKVKHESYKELSAVSLFSTDSDSDFDEQGSTKREYDENYGMQGPSERQKEIDAHRQQLLPGNNIS